MGPLSIRAARPGDAETLFVAHRESAMTAYVEVFPPDLYRFPDAQMRKVWAEALRSEDTSVLIAERAGSPVGFATASSGWLRNLFVLPAEWGRGDGAALHDEALALLRRHGAIAQLWVLEARTSASLLRSAGLAGRWRPVEVDVPASSARAQVRAPAR